MSSSGLHCCSTLECARIELWKQNKEDRYANGQGNTKGGYSLLNRNPF